MNKFIIVLSLSLCMNIVKGQTNSDQSFTLGRYTDSVKMNRDTTQRMTRKMMIDELGLTKQQRSSIKMIQQNHKAQKEAIMNNDSLSMEQKKIQLKELRKKTENNIDAILTEEQRQKRDELKKQMSTEKMNDPQKTTMQDDEPGYENTTKSVN